MAIRGSKRPDTVKVKLGDWFEASANGRVGILTVAILGLAFFCGKAMGWL